MNSMLIWDTARASGFVTLGLVSTSVLAGLGISLRAARRPIRRAWLLDLHRFLGATAIAFLGIHVGSILLDTYTHFGVVNVLVPFTGSWHPVAVAWGIAGMYLLAAVELTSLLRRRMSLRAWRATHYLTFPLFAFSIVHALTAGTDRHSMYVRGGVVAVTAAVAGLLLARIALPWIGRTRTLQAEAAWR
jgi:sulfoxide reductase heme-binding subunit YedZ